MADLNSIRRCILDMPAQDVMDIHLSIRASRRISKRPFKKRKTPERSNVSKVLSMVDGMNEGELSLFMERLK